MGKKGNRGGKRNPDHPQARSQSSLPRSNALSFAQLLPPPVQSNNVRSDRPRDRVLQSLAGLIGTTVTLTTKTAARYEGTVASTANQGDTTGVTLKDVKDLTTPGGPLKASIFIASTNIQSYTPGSADLNPAGGDTGVSMNQKKLNVSREHELQTRLPYGGAFGAAGGGAINLNGDPDTTKLDHSAADVREREHRAGSLTAQILAVAASNPLVEERNGANDSRVNEEGSQSASNLPGGTGAALLPPSITTAVPTGAPRDVVSVDGTDIAVPQSQSPPRSTLPPIVGAANTTDVAAFRDFITHEKQRLSRKRQALVNSGVDRHMAELVRFNQGFKLNKPIPDDLVPILTKDEEKQRLIKEKSKQDAESRQARVIGTSTAARPRVTSATAFRRPLVELDMPGVLTTRASSTTAKPPVRPEASKLDSAVKKVPMFIQPIPPFKGNKANQSPVAGTLALSSANASGDAKLNSEGASPSTVVPIKDAVVLPDLEQLESVGVKNLFRGVQPLKKSVYTHIHDEFNLFKDSKVTELNQIAPQRPDQGTVTTTPMVPALAVPTASASDAPVVDVTELDSDILQSRDQRARIEGFLGDDAQVVVDYLDTISHEVDILEVDERRRALNLLCKLAGLAKLFPRCYTLTGIRYTGHAVAGGSFADVWRGEYEDKQLCLKVVRTFSKQGNDKILQAHVQELALWAHLSHKNILPFYGVYLIDEELPRTCLVSPWMEGGNLRDYLGKFPEKPRINFISDIVDGLRYLHDLQIVHSDLKPVDFRLLPQAAHETSSQENVLVSGDERALIADFGLSSIMTTTTLTSGGGTAYFMAPELLIGDGKITQWCDIWSFACLCYEISIGEVPFYQYKQTQIRSAMRRKEIPHLPDGRMGRNIWGHGETDDLVWDLLARCWSYVPRHRPSCKAIQEALGDVRFRDDRPEATTELGTSSSFWRAMREKSGNEVDYVRVEEILLSIYSGHAPPQSLE